MPNTRIQRIIASLAALTFALPITLPAQNLPDSRAVRGPVIGFVHDGPMGIRPILGIPGAATLGPAVIAGADVESWALAPGGDCALAVLAQERQVAIVWNLSGVPGSAVLDLPAGPARIAWSPSGGAAALFYADTSRVEVVTGLPASPSRAWNFDLAEVRAGLAALAVSDGGGALLAAAAGKPAPVWLVAPDIGQRFLYAAAASPRVAFLSRSDDAAIADGFTGDVVLVRDPKGDLQVTRAGGRAEGSSRPVAIVASRDNRRLLVANAEPAGVVSLELSGGEPFRLDCACAPTTLERMAGGDVFRLNEPGRGPIWLLDAAGRAPRIVFVPEQVQLLRDTGRAPAPRRTWSDR